MAQQASKRFDSTERSIGQIRFEACVLYLSLDLRRYYRAQRLISDAEWPDFEETLRRPLPHTFRVPRVCDATFERLVREAAAHGADLT